MSLYQELGHSAYHVPPLFALMIIKQPMIFKPIVPWQEFVRSGFLRAFPAHTSELSIPIARQCIVENRMLFVENSFSTIGVFLGTNKKSIQHQRLSHMKTRTPERHSHESWTIS
jgi:hypothetical protein